MEGRLAAVKAGGRTLMAAAYDGDGNRIMQASPYHEQVPGAEGSAGGDDAASGADAGQEGVSLWSLGLFWYGFAAEGAALLASANPAVMVGAVETACGLIEATWPEGALDPDAADYALAHLGLPAFDLAAMTGGYGVSDGEPATTAELLDVVTYTNSSVIAGVAQVAFSHSTRSGESTEAYGLERLSKDGSSYAYDGRGSVTQTLSTSGSVSSWQMWGAFGEQEAGSALGELPSYGYNAEEAHPQTGPQYLRARYYDASTGRFGVQDSYLGQTTDPLTLNRYLYCLSDPLNLIDPSGYAGTRRYTSGRLGSSYSPAYGKRTLINRSGNRNSVQARYEAQGKQNLKYVLSGDFLRSLTANKAINYQLNYANALNGGSRSNANYWYRCALAAQQELLRYCNGDVGKMTDYISTAAKNREMLHFVLDLGGFFSFAFDLVNAQIYYLEGDTESGDLSVASAVPILGWGTTATKLIKKGTHIANGAEAIIDTRKVFEHTSPGKLERNMKAIGILTPPYAYNAHHIVAKGDKRAEPARQILSKYGIDIDDAVNGVFLPVGKEVTEGTNHWGLHTDEYYKAINESLEGAKNKEQAIKALEEISASLANGTFK